MMDLDFIGFTYNGKHSWNDLGIYRTSEGSRYNDNLTPTLNDKTADNTGGDGQYFFYTKAKNKTFSVSYAFDSLTENGLRKLKQVFDGREIHDLIFDETPYKTWSAKVTGNSQIKHLCFVDTNGDRVYKGEGSIQFTCYWPYARSSDISNCITLSDKVGMPAKKAIPCNLFTQAGEAYKLINNLNSQITVKFAEWENEDWGEDKTKIVAVADSLIFSKSTWIKEVNASVAVNAKTCLTLGGYDYYYTSFGTFEYFGEKDGRNINHYPPSIFLNNQEWAPGAGMLSTPIYGENYGDLPASFVYTNSAQILANTTIELGNIGSITILEDCTNLTWDSRTGLVTGRIGDIVRPIYYTGNSLISIPVGEKIFPNLFLQNEELKYNYWYY